MSLDDHQFAQYNVSGGQIPSEHIEWERQQILNNSVFLTDFSVTKLPQYKALGIKSNAFLIESPWNTKFEHLYANIYQEKFDTIYTHNRTLLKLPNARFIPAGGCWILPEERKIHKKVDLCSMVVSAKKHLAGHKVRHLFKDYLGSKVRGFGEGYLNYVGYKHLTTKPFMYQVVVENAKEDYYFTEKLLDCFQSGTIPIYWGCPSIGKFFNKKGILSFNTIEDLKKIFDRIGEKDYEKRVDAIHENFELSKQYLTAEDYMYKHYYNRLT